MALLGNSSSFCVFCYRCDNHSMSTLAETKNLSLFLKLFGRFNGDRDSELDKHLQSISFQDLLLSSKIGCCKECVFLVNGFCDTYHQLKCLEIQLEWKIEKFMNIIKLANRVPSRIIKLTKALQVQEAADGKTVADHRENGKLKVLKTFRNCFAKKCRKRLLKSQPRVLLNKNNASLEKVTHAEKQLLEKSFNKCLIPENNAALITSTEKPTAKLVDPILSQNDSLSSFANAIEPDEEANCQDFTSNYQMDVVEDTNDNDSTFHYDNDDDPLNCEDFSEENAQDHNNIDPLEENSKDSPYPLIETKMEFPRDIQIQEDTVIPVVASQSIPISLTSPSLIIKNVFSQLPLPLNEVLSKTFLCTVCKKHFVSQDWLDKHVQSAHSDKNSSKVQKRHNLKKEKRNQKSIDTTLIKTCLEDDIKTPLSATVSQNRYSLREKRSTVKYMGESDNDNDDVEYTAENGFSSSDDDASDFEDSKADIIKPIKNEKEDAVKSIKKAKPKNLKKRVEYTKCKICNKKTTTKFLKTHIKTWHDKTNLPDNQIKNCTSLGCTAYFLTQEQLKFHKRNEHDKIFRCHFCQKTFPRRILLGRHLRHSHGKSLHNPIKCLEDQQLKPKEFKCNFCKFSTISPTKLAIHETIHALPLPDEPSNSKLRRCPRCSYTYVHRMQRHYVMHHLRHHLSYLTGESSGACKMCSTGKIYVENTKKHFDIQHNTDLLEDPTQIIKCDECPAYYLKPFQLHRHKQRIHASLTCKECGRTFALKSSLKAHMRIIHKDHESNPGLPVPCTWPNCEKRFGSEGEMEFHIIYTHKRNPEEKKGSVVCEICGRGFKSNGLLRVHKEKIHVEKKWVCNECGKVFKRKAPLEIHLEYHKGPESWKFECKECGKKCQDKWKLVSHMNTHTKEKPFICQFCGEKYAHRHNWRNHLKSKHMDEEGVEEIVNSKKSQMKGNYLSRKGTKKGDCIISGSAK